MLLYFLVCRDKFLFERFEFWSRAGPLRGKEMALGGRLFITDWLGDLQGIVHAGSVRHGLLGALATRQSLVKITVL